MKVQSPNHWTTMGFPTVFSLLLLLLSHFSHVQLCVTPPISSWQINGETMETVTDFWGRGAPKSLQMVIAAMKLNTRLPHPWYSLGKNTGVGCHFLLQCMKVKRESEVAQLCLTLSDPMDCSPLGSSGAGPCIVRKDPRVPHTARRGA